jgi:hypothetical protein
MTVGGDRPRLKAAKFHTIHPLAAGVGEFESIAPMLQRLFEDTRHRHIVALGEQFGIFADHQKPTGRNRALRGKLELDATNEFPPRDVHRLAVGIVEFDPLEVVEIVRRVIKDLIDYNASGNAAGEEQRSDNGDGMSFGFHEQGTGFARSARSGKIFPPDKFDGLPGLRGLM